MTETNITEVNSAPTEFNPETEILSATIVGKKGSQLTINLNIVRDNPLSYEPSIADFIRWYQPVIDRYENENLVVDVSLVEPDYIQELNATYRGKDYVTNVLSFPRESFVFDEEFFQGCLEYDDEEEGEEISLEELLANAEIVDEREADKQDEEVEAEILGDIIISPEKLEQEAQEQEKPLAQHYAHISIHGLLHLLGFDHIEKDERLEMEALEKELLAELGIADPYRDDITVDEY